MKLAGAVIFYNPNSQNVSNINDYISLVDKLYIIDNSSKDNSNMLPQNDKIVYVANMQNLGIAKALNSAANLAIKDKYSWMLTLDQDSHLTKSELKQMIDYINKNDTSKIGILSPWHVINTNEQKPKKEIDYPLEVMTSGNLVNLKIYLEIGGWDNKMFIDCVDFDYCMNLKIHGFKVVRLNYVEMKHNLGDIKVIHFCRRNFVCSNHNYIRRYYMVRNTFYLSKKYDGYFPEYFHFLKRGLRGQMQNIILFEKDKYRKIRNMYRGYIDFKKNKMGKYSYKN